MTKDYYKQLARGLSEAETVINDFLKVIMLKSGGAATPHALCHLANETVCEAIALVIFEYVKSPASGVSPHSPLPYSTLSARKSTEQLPFPSTRNKPSSRMIRG